EILLALDLYLRRRPHPPGADDPEVEQLSDLLNSLPIHTVRPDLDKFRNPNSVALKLANFAALDPEFPGKGMEASSKLDREMWNRYNARPDEVASLVSAIKAVATGGGFPNIPEPDEDEDEPEEG